MKAPRWMIRSAVVLTALLCLGVAGYAGQVWWAKKLAEDMPDPWVMKEGFPEPALRDYSPYFIASHIGTWKATPWYGEFFPTGCKCWRPRRTYYEFFRRIAPAIISDDSAAWEAWFQAHPNLVWDDKLKRLVEKP